MDTLQVKQKFKPGAGVDANREKVKLTVFNNPADASQTIALEIAAMIRQKQQDGQQAVLGMATGSTPKRIYDCLVLLHREEGLSFKNVTCFNLDEYYGLGKENSNSYYTFMWNNLFRHIDIEPGNCHIPDGLVNADEVDRHCRRYEEMIRQCGGIDIQILGIGRNGHIGFNEPGSHENSNTRLITLDRTTRSDALGDFGGLMNVPKKAITMGISTILGARKIYLLAWGEGKAAIIKKTIEGPVTDEVPASFLQKHNAAEIFVDSFAAADLTRIQSPWLIDQIVWDKAMMKRAVVQLAFLLKKPILKLTNADYNENGISDLLALFGNAYDINIEVFNLLQQTITGWPGGKPNVPDRGRPERAEPAKKRVLLFSPHPDDDIISMGGTFQRLVDQGHDVHVAYQTSGNIAVADDEALRFIEFITHFNKQFNIESKEANDIYENAKNFLSHKTSGEKDTEAVRQVKGIIRRGEAANTCRFVGIPEANIHFLNMPFYETGSVEKKPLSEEDYMGIEKLIAAIKPHQVYAAGDLADPHGTHKVCLDAIFEAVKRLKHHSYMNDCRVWLYKGAWAEWSIDLIEMAVPMSPEQLLKKRQGIFKHQSQKDGVVFQGDDSREFWQRAEDRNRQTASEYNQLGLAEYEAMEAFVRWKF